MNERELSSCIREALCIPEFLEHAQHLYELEKNVCHSDFDASTRYCMDIMRQAGFQDVERLEMPCDGKSCALDTIMPEAWDRTGRCYLEIQTPGYSDDEKILTDTDDRPLSAATWSGPTPEGGATGEIVNFADCDPACPDVKGKFVFFAGNARGEAYYQCARHGALGMVCTDFEQGEIYPDAIRWMNGPGRCAWYHVKEDLKIPVFVMTARKARWLLDEMKKHTLLLHGVMKTRIYDGKIYTVTARIPGEEESEFGLFAHVYEPFPNDDASGFAAVVALGRTMKSLSDRGILKLKKSIRLVISMELYGFSHFLADPRRADKIFAAQNMDAICCKPIFHDPQRLRMSALCNPYFGDLELERLFPILLPNTGFVLENGNLSDDTFASDPQLDIPTLWIYNVPEKFHHCTCPAFADIDPKMAEDILTLLGTHLFEILGGENYRETAARVVSRTLEDYRKQLRKIQDAKTQANDLETDFQCRAARMMAEGRIHSLDRLARGLYDEDDIQSQINHIDREYAPSFAPYALTPAQKQADNMIFTRMTKGFPFCFARIPYEKRPASRMAPLQLYALFDGRRTLLECLELLHGFHLQHAASDETLTALMDFLKYLAEYGYFQITQRER